ncbi:MAG: DUF2283 domain-containing protein [Verrucomicrobia bacterium]|jgi:uncharacterized protein YuzE|nr:DUF2283 domain-containing protein [Verrucomicrobiota bacterium]
MSLTYDPRYNIAYIRFAAKPAEVQTLQIGDELNIDIAPDGRVCGIELVNASAQLSAEDEGRLIVQNDAGGWRTEVPLVVQ